ncbi:hypothetical protein DIURU_004751 [Diutina rugosa]|uniref:Trafficking protein particle complex II-specific subunit 65 IgD3 domain-containing protein n=1 Tax=Diutina rugosa TaxID=5481 RepID=A0A642UF37_DIURU|nr:uncharacterized protein DIURU_004751 [Diutina rugosa]KAA8897898.1 hypothetical protein DIURU_004751 [Diutina rugosa]
MSLSLELSVGTRARAICFFDERVTGYVVSHGPVLPQARVSVAVSIVPHDRIDAFKQANGDFPDAFSVHDAVLTEAEPRDDGTTVYPFSFTITYPRTKFDNPHVVVMAQMVEEEEILSPQANLPDLEPRSRNLLAELNHQYLSAAIYETGGPLPPVNTIRANPRAQVHWVAPVNVALSLKLKTMKAAGRNSMLLASLTLASDLDGFKIVINDMSVDFKHGSVSRIYPQPWPVTFASGDNINFTYCLTNEEELDTKHILIKLKSEVHQQIDNEWTAVSGDITTSWTPLVDFCIIAPPINHLLRTAVKKKIRPKKTNTVTVNLSVNNILSGLRLTFNGRPTIEMGDVAVWRLQAVNNSPNRITLSLLVQQKQFSLPVGADPEACDNTQLSLAYQAPKPQTGVVVLDNGLRIGPLDPNSVYDTDIRLFGVSRGIHNLEGVKIFDVHSGEGLDFGKLVEVYVV